MKIITLTAENIKKLVAVEIKPDGSLVQITGKNGQGKTSVLDSIWWALSGARNIQGAPIRKGQTQARIKLDMGDIVVTRTFKKEAEGEGFTTKLEVAGNVKGSPQSLLDSLLDSLAFDPLSFARMDANQQFEALRSYIPDLDFTVIATANSLDSANRKEINRKAKEERILADQITVSDKLPEAAIDETALIKELAEAGKHNSDIQLRTANRMQAADAIAQKRNQIEAMRKQAQAIMENADVLEKEASALTEKLKSATPLPTPIDVENLQAKITEARTINAAIQRRESKSAHHAAATRLEAEAKKLTEQMLHRDAEKTKKIASAKLPIESVTFGTDPNSGKDIVLLAGVPFNQASDAEQLRASCALAMAGNPALKVIRVRDGSLLDENGLSILGKMAEERGFQVWIERVGSGKVGFILEDGHLAEPENLEVQA